MRVCFRKSRARLGLVCTLVALSAGHPISAVAASGSQETQAPVKVGVSFITYSAFQFPEFVAIERGFLQEAGIQPDLHLARNDQDVIQWALSGEAPISSGPSTDAMIVAIARGAPLKLVMSKTVAAPYSLIANPRFQTIPDLQGQTLAVSQLTGASTLLLQKLLEQGGLRRGDYRLVVAGGTSDRYAALRSGRVAAAVLAPPQSFAALDAGFRELGRVADVIPVWEFNSVTVNSEWASKNPKVVRGFVQAMLKALRWISDPTNRTEGIEILSKWTRTDPNTSARAYDYFVVQLSAYSKDGRPRPQVWKIMIDLLLELGHIPPGEHPIDRYWDLSYLE